MVLAPRKGRTAVVKQPTGEVVEMAHGWPQGEGAGGGAAADTGVPRAIFVPHANSLPFEERCVSVEQAVKIGRNVCKTAPTQTNAIFECRVLSRHHATLWYEKGHFYIMDNHSSNGTFINNNRCSIGKDSEPHEVFSGDMLQFGIAVVENHTDQEHVKNTFLPVVALLKLYHPDGKEAKMVFNPTMATPPHLKELYQLNSFVQEAISREADLESRLQALKESVELTRGEALAGWELLVGEQRLLARVHALENELAAGKNVSDQQLRDLLRDKANYREAAQESLRIAHEVRLSLEEALDKKTREAHALLQHNCELRQDTERALSELQTLAARCERKMAAAKVAIASAEESEASKRALLPLALSRVHGEALMLVVSPDSGRSIESHDSALGEAVLALPDYIKLLLPDKLLAQIGLKTVKIDGISAEECKLILKNNLVGDKLGAREENISAWLQDPRGWLTRPNSTDNSAEEKNGIANHDSPESNSTGEENLKSSQLSPDNNANSTFRRVENHNNLEGGKKEEMLVDALRGLRDEVTTLRARLAEVTLDNERLRHATLQLLRAEEPRARRGADESSTNSESDADTEKRDPESRKELAARLERALAAERGLAAELAARPTLQSYGDLTAACDELRRELRERDALVDELRRSASTTTTVTATPATTVSATSTILPDEMSALSELDDALDEFGCDECEPAGDPGPAEPGPAGDDGELEAALANLDAVNAEHDADPEPESADEKGAREALEKELDCVGSGEEARVRALEAEERLASMQEELVRAKESWAAARADLARLSGARSLDARLHALAAAAAAAALAAYVLVYSYYS